MFRVTILLYLSIIHGLTTAASSHIGQYCSQTCEATLDYVTFNDTNSELSRKARQCRSSLHITSAYLCVNSYCGDDDVEAAKWIDGRSTWCLRHINVSLPEYHEIVDRWNSDQVAAVGRFNASEASSFPTFSEVVLPDEAIFESAYSTLEAALYEYAIHVVYGWYMIYFWLVVVTIGISNRLLGLIRTINQGRRGYRPISDGESPASSKIGKPSSVVDTWLKRCFITPATFGKRCSQPYGTWCTIPARAQSCNILAFVLLNVFACVGDYRLTDRNIYWPEKSAQLLRYVSDRTGIVSLANFPLIWLFGMRNDVLLWLTGWGFGTFNAFHRWVARVATVEAIIHSLGYTVMIWEGDGWKGFAKYWTKHYFWNGELTTIAMCALLAFSFYGIRRSHYEIFLVTHIVLSIVALWTIYYHVEIFIEGEWNIFIWPCLAIWIIDRVLRAARILILNSRFWNTAEISYDSDADLVKMEIPLDHCWLRRELLQPGSYYYVYALDDLRYAHQNHPFTMAYVSPFADPNPATALRPLHQSEDSSECDSLLNPRSKSGPCMVFLIRPYDGFTARLMTKCHERSTKLPVLVEGPYGHSESLHAFANVLFIVGGTGIAMPLSHLKRLLSFGSSARSLKIIWAVRQHSFLASVLAECDGLLADERVEMEVHVTRQDEAYDDVLGEDLRNVRLMAGRPDVRTSVQCAAKEAGTQPLAIIACGPARMADEARQASVAMLAAGHAGIEFFEESFKW